jgi:hypothetical protein
MADAGQTISGKPRGADRRGGDRRVADEPFEGAERRNEDRRSGRDRRAEARTRLQL